MPYQGRFTVLFQGLNACVRQHFIHNTLSSRFGDEEHVLPWKLEAAVSGNPPPHDFFHADVTPFSFAGACCGGRGLVVLDDACCHMFP